jgi:RNase P protein component
LCPSLRPGADIVIVARSRILDASFDQVQAALTDTLSRASLLDGPPPGSTSVGGLQF